MLDELEAENGGYDDQDAVAEEPIRDKKNLAALAKSRMFPVHHYSKGLYPGPDSRPL